MSIARLLADLGPRLAGTPACDSVAELLSERFRKAGLQVELQPFSFHGWEPDGQASLTVTTPEPVAVTAATMIRSAQGVAHGVLTPLGPRPVIGVFTWEAYAIVSEGQTVGMLYERADGPAIPQCLEELSPIPAAVVGKGWRDVLPARGVGLPVRLETRCHSYETRSHNVIARRPGRGVDEILMCAHYDTMYDSPGANDNASGVDVVIQLAERMIDCWPDVHLTYAAFSGEEWLQLGSQAYLNSRQREGTLNRIRLVLNIDMVGSGSYLWPSVTDQTEHLVERACREIAPQVELVYHKPPMRGDHYPYHEAGVPTIMLLWWPDDVYHSPADRGEQLSPETLALSTRLAHRMVELAVEDR